MIHRWYTWLSLLIAILVLGEGAGWLLWAQGQPEVGVSMMWVGRLIAAGWLGYGLWRWRGLPWVRRVALAVIASLAAWLVAGVALDLGFVGWAMALGGAWAMAMLFGLGVLLIRWLVSAGHPILGIAHALIDEAVRMKVAMVFIVMLLLVVPMLPLSLDPDVPLNHRIKWFLTWSIMAVSLLLSLMTIFLAVRTITGEMDRRQIFMTLTKPVSRGQYLLGKWIGIILLNAVLVTVAGAGVYVFTKVLEHQSSINPQDRYAVEQEVLTARRPVKPRPGRDMDLSQRFLQRLNELRRQNPAAYGSPGDPPGLLDDAQRREIQRRVLHQWHSIGPLNATEYVFAGMGGVQRTRGRAVQLRLKPKAASSSPDSFIYLGIRVDGRPFATSRNMPMTRFNGKVWGVLKLLDDAVRTLPIPARAIGEDGSLNVRLANLPRPDQAASPTVSFNLADGLRLYSPAGTFGGNLARAMGLIWLSQVFLAMLGLAAGTALGFPVASLVSLGIFIAAVFSGFLQSSLKMYAAFPDSQKLSAFEQLTVWPRAISSAAASGQGWKVVQVVIRAVGEGFLALVPQLGAYNPAPQLADGVLIGAGQLGLGALWVGLIWTGAAGLIGWMIFSRREIASVTA